MKKRHFTRLSAFALAAALSVITASTPFSDAFPITASVTVSAADDTTEGGTGSENLTEGSVEINETNFPDANFRNWILAQNYGTDNVLTADEIAAVKGIDVRSANISSLKGIEYFTNITYLNCYNNNLTLLDVSQNTKIVSLFCDLNQLKSLDVSKNTEIETLCCQQNQLTSLDVSTNTKLENFYCYKNQLTSLDVSKNTKLSFLNCNSNNITSLDLTNNLQISNISIADNPILSLDCGSAKPSAFSADPLYMFMVEDGNELVLADKHINPDKIQRESIKGGTLESGIITPDEGSGKVTYDYVYNDAGETITCSVGFGIAVNETNFPDEIFRNYVKTELTNSNGNKVGGDGILTADEIAAVTEINVGYKNISSLKGIEYFTALTLLDCRWNQLTSLDLSKNTALTELFATEIRLLF